MLWLLVLYLVRVLHAHPQCLDFRAPFVPNSTFTVCKKYEEFGCCGPFETWRIDGELRRLIRKAESLSLPRQCDTYLEDLLCQKCSPYAAHLFDVEGTRSQPKVFPGLSRQYCTDLFRTCSPILSSVATNQNLSSKLSDVDVFCDYAKASDEDYAFPDLLTNEELSGRITQPQTTNEDCLCMEEFPAGPLRVPLIFRHAGDGSRRIFIGERSGVIFTYLANGRKVKEPFLNLSSSVLTTDSPGEERGLLGLAFHPQFKTNGKLYIHYSTSLGQREFVKISEFLVSENDENVADHTTERLLFQVSQPYWNHNGGELLFGDDGYLYITLGDGGSAGDPHGYAQNRNSLLGKILRIDVDSRTDDLPYGIPPDNPFNGTNGRREIYAYGLRNVWRCGKDRGDEKGQNKGRIFCGDVGQSNYEEIDIIQKGGNYGWNAREGVACYKADICGTIGAEIFPIHSYDHSEGKSVIGGHVYRGCLNPNLRGLYIYGDHMNGRLFRLREEFGAWSSSALTMCGNDVCMNGLVGQYPPNINTLGEDEFGELYIVTFQRSFSRPDENTGKVYRLVDPRRRGNPETCIPARTTLANLLNATSSANLYQKPNTTFAPSRPDDTTTASPYVTSLPPSTSVAMTTGKPNVMRNTWLTMKPVDRRSARGNQASAAMPTNRAAILVTMVACLLLTGSGTVGWT